MAWLAGLSPLPIVLKGITRAEDAVLAHEHGAAGIIVSNHGGQGLAHAVPVAEALPAIVDATQGNVEVLVDGGIRSGLDVLRALALGARAVLVARPILWGLTVAGPQGVEGVVTSLRDEFDTSMALTGCTAIEDIDDAVFLPRRNPQP
ncbi:alpha-hydroxy-acid oxidizing protein [Arthrobacter sp. SD76]|uniref:alpha-hydroxy-acid oxidizing protein n=1 Tax=Arthrobacter sp. SD76 TaxID=3415007 RepID=UPI003C767296